MSVLAKLSTSLRRQPEAVPALVQLKVQQHARRHHQRNDIGGATDDGRGGSGQS